MNTYKLNTPLTKGIWFDHWHAVEYDNDVEAAIAIVLALKEKTRGITSVKSIVGIDSSDVPHETISIPDTTSKLKKLINQCLDLIDKQEN